MYNHADALRLIEQLGQNHPNLPQALTALGLSLKEQREVTTTDKSTVVKDLGSPKPLPVMAREYFNFPLTLLSKRENLGVQDQPILEKIAATPPLNLEQKLIPITINPKADMLWDAAALYQQLAPLLWQQKLTTEPDVAMLIKHVVKKEPMNNLPRKKIGHYPAEIWLYLDYSDCANVYNAHYEQIERLLKQWFGNTAVTKTLKLNNVSLDYHWQVAHKKIKKQASQPPSGVSVIAVAPSDNWQNPHWQALASAVTNRNLCVFLPLQGLPHLSIPTQKSLKGLDKLLSALSLSPNVITLSMIYEIIDKVVKAPIDLAAKFVASSNVYWYQGHDRGFLQGDLTTIQQQIATHFSSHEQEQIIDILNTHLSHHDMSWAVGAQALAYIHCTDLASKRKERLESELNQYYQGLASHFNERQVKDHVQWQMLEARKLGEHIKDLPEDARRALTVANLLYQEQFDSKEQLDGLDEALWQQWHQKNSSSFTPAKLIQKGSGLHIEENNNEAGTALNSGCLITEITDVKSLYSEPSIALQDSKLVNTHNGSVTNSQVKITDKTQSLTLTTCTSNDFYWAKLLSVTREGVVAKTNFVKVSWPSGEVSSERGYKGAVIELLEGAPEWMKLFMPQLDKYGLFVDIHVNDGTTSQKLNFKLRYIPPGHFIMGSPIDEPERRDNETQHHVQLTTGYWLGETTISQALWQAVRGENPSEFKKGEAPLMPVDSVSWDDCQRFLNEFNQHHQGLSLSLPSEAQWEYACRAGTTTPFYTGSNLTTTEANYDGNFPYNPLSNNNEKVLYREKTLPLIPSDFTPNAWGLYQMHGNVWEWSQDEFGDYNELPAIDPVNEGANANSSALRVLRGGGWHGLGHYCRSASRRHFLAGGAVNNIGLRVTQVEPAGNKQ